MENKKMTKADKKIMIKFVGIMVVSLVLGYLLGMLSNWLGASEGISDTLKHIAALMQQATPILFVLVNVVILTAAFIVYIGVKKKADAWDGEDEELIARIEDRLNVPVLLSSILMVLNFFFFSAMVEIMEHTDYGQEHETGLFVVLMVTFILGWVFAIIIQKQVIDLEKKLNPEKRGNIFDTQFLKEWEASCDEAQRLIIYKAAYAAYKAVNTACMALWLVTLIAGLELKTGLMPVFCVTVVWLASVITYSVTAAKLERG